MSPTAQAWKGSIARRPDDVGEIGGMSRTTGTLHAGNKRRVTHGQEVIWGTRLGVDFRHVEAGATTHT
jgi:hypothetical protein